MNNKIIAILCAVTLMSNFTVLAEDYIQPAQEYAADKANEDLSTEEKDNTVSEPEESSEPDTAAQTEETGSADAAAETEKSGTAGTTVETEGSSNTETTAEPEESDKTDTVAEPEETDKTDTEESSENITEDKENLTEEKIENINEETVSENGNLAGNEENAGVELVSVQNGSEEDLKSKLGGIIDRIKASDYEEVAEEESISAVKQALSSAETVYENAEASETEISNEINGLNKATEEIKYVSKQYILSGNGLSDADMNTYYQDVLTEDTDVSYTYDETSAPGLKKNDTANTKLTDGNLKTAIMSKNTDGDTVVIFDMGGEYYINGVDVFSNFMCYPTFSMNIGGFKVEVSRDGSDYTEAASADAKTDPDEGETGNLNYLLKTESKFPVYLGRYVKVTIKKDTVSADGRGSMLYNLLEIVVQGFKNPYSKDDLFEALNDYSDVDRAIYTAGSYDKYVKAYKAAEEIYWDESINGKEIYTAKSDLQDAYNSLENCAEIKILSGNITLAEDRDLYKDFDIDTLSNISYTYTDQTPPQIITQDSTCTRLLSGKCKSTDGTRIVYGDWGTQYKPAAVLFDLGEECYVSGVDIWDVVLNSYCRTAKAEIFVSSDGVNFESVSQTDVPEGLHNSTNLIEQNFEAKKCRYLKVVATTATYQVVLGEIVIRGYKAGNTETAPGKLGILDYKNSRGERILSLDGESTVNVSGQIASKNSEDKNVIVISAAYSGNKMIDWSFKEMELKAYEKADFTNSLNISGYSGVSIESYVWDSVESGNGLAKTKNFGSL